ncbi:hypothetical protein [Gemmata sp. SH-PL17]|uniref:hypothetical protein n=1 Tax=Gemmata sp. SH-PL17 TaxID=1630693 RepID=UPI0012FA04C2|nr:hypothetical protein [Gemmata sp. SH-PL17]
MPQFSTTHTFWLWTTTRTRRELRRTDIALCGYRAKGVTAGPAALREIAGDLPDVIFTGLLVHGLDGFEITRVARRLRGHLHAFIALTGAHEAGLRLADDFGFDAIVRPPAATDTLVALLRQFQYTLT